MKEKIINLFVVRPMNGVSYDADRDLMLAIEKCIRRELSISAPSSVKVLNKWEGFSSDWDLRAGRIWNLGQSLSMLEFADVVVIVKDSWRTAKGCAIERRVIENYAEIYDSFWTMFQYDPTKDELVLLTTNYVDKSRGIYCS